MEVIRLNLFLQTINRILLIEADLQIEKKLFAVGEIVSQKAHLALKWLIKTGGISVGDEKICCVGKLSE